MYIVLLLAPLQNLTYLCVKINTVRVLVQLYRLHLFRSSSRNNFLC